MNKPLPSLELNYPISDETIGKISESLEARALQHTRESILGILPIDLSRPIKPLRNTTLLYSARELEMLDTPTETDHIPHPQTRRTDILRGEVSYIDHVIQRLAIEQGLRIHPAQVLTGTSGAQELITSALDKWINEGMYIAATEFTNPSAKHFLDIRLEADQKKLFAIPFEYDGSGLNMDEAIEFLEGGHSVFFLERTITAEGSTVQVEQIQKLAKVAEDSGSIILLDDSTSKLPHAEQGFESYEALQPYIDKGNVVIVASHENLGGITGPAHIIGSKKEIDELYQEVTAKRGGPHLHLQRQQVLLESLQPNALGDILTFASFLDQKIRPHIALNHAITKQILMEGGVELSSENVTHGYQVSVYLPINVVEEDEKEFYKVLKELGVTTNDLTRFIVDSNNSGFRFPFGGLTAEECTVACHLIVEAYDKIWPKQES